MKLAFNSSTIQEGPPSDLFCIPSSVFSHTFLCLPGIEVTLWLLEVLCLQPFKEQAHKQKESTGLSTTCSSGPFQCRIWNTLRLFHKYIQIPACFGPAGFVCILRCHFTEDRRVCFQASKSSIKYMTKCYYSYSTLYTPSFQVQKYLVPTQESI